MSKKKSSKDSRDNGCNSSNNIPVHVWQAPIEGYLVGTSYSTAYSGLAPLLTLGAIFATMRVGARNTVYRAVAHPTESGIFCCLFLTIRVIRTAPVFGWGAVVRKAIGMARYMFRTPRPPYTCRSVEGGYQSHRGDLTMSKLIPITTHSLINRDSKPYVAIRPICDALFLDWSSQHKRLLRNPVLSKGMVIMTTPSNGDSQDAVCLPLSMLNGWLFGINANRVKNPEIRQKLIEYQFECYDALNNYWNGKAVTSRTSNISGDLINLKCLCSHMIWLNGWWARYQDAVRGFNRIVAASVHDHFNDGAFVVAQFIGKYSLDVVPSKVARNFPWDANDQEKHDYYTLTRNEKR